MTTSNILALEFLGPEGTGRTYADLKEAHGINFRFSQDGEKVSLNYDMIASKYGDPVAEQCRGLVLNVRTMEVLCRPMDRFYNAGDHHAAKVDWSDPDLRVYEKLDGTMIAVYHDGQKWCCATRSVPDADIPIKAGDLEIGDATFSDLFWMAFKRTMRSHEEWTMEEEFGGHEDITFIFELTSPHNRIVVEYPEARVTLLAVRECESGLEHDPWHYGYPMPKQWKLDSAEAVHAFVNTASPHELEGAVVCDSQFRRVKVKSKAYVLASKCASTVGTSFRSALEAAILGKLDDVIPLVSPAMQKKLSELQSCLAEYIVVTNGCISAFKEQAVDRKDFAGKVLSMGLSQTDIFFKMYPLDKPDVSSYLLKMAENGKLTDNMLDSLLKDMGQL